MNAEIQTAIERLIQARQAELTAVDAAEAAETQLKAAVRVRRAAQEELASLMRAAGLAPVDGADDGPALVHDGHVVNLTWNRGNSQYPRLLPLGSPAGEPTA
jgi:hypothetical protein